MMGQEVSLKINEDALTAEHFVHFCESYFNMWKS